MRKVRALNGPIQVGLLAAGGCILLALLPFVSIADGAVLAVPAGFFTWLAVRQGSKQDDYLGGSERYGSNRWAPPPDSQENRPGS